MVDQKGLRMYIGGKKRDIHEADLEHLQAAEKTYLEIATKFNYKLIECYENGQVLSREKIAEKIWEKVRKILP